MRGYYDFLAKGIKADQAIWSEIYKDAITNLDFITAAKPIYVVNKFNTKLLLGVAGVDLLLEDIQKNKDYKTVLNKL